MRRGGRTGWLPLELLWAPALIVGVWLLAGMRVQADGVGPGQSVVQFVVLSPQHWFDVPGRGVAGVVLVVLGLTLWVVSRWNPVPSRVLLTVQRYPAFVLAALVFAAVAVLAAWATSGHVLDAHAGGLSWRFVATRRNHPMDWVVWVGAVVLALACYALSFGRARVRGGRSRRGGRSVPVASV